MSWSQNIRACSLDFQIISFIVHNKRELGNDNYWGGSWLFPPGDDSQGLRGQLGLYVNVGLGLNLLVNVGLSGDLHVLVGNDLGGSAGCSSKTN